MEFQDGWYQERYFHKKAVNGYKIKSVLHDEKSKWQHIQVIDTDAVGKLLLLDGKTMVSELDEFIYHEIMGHIPMMTHPQVKDVLIIGGGDGGIVREYVKWPEVKSVTLVEIDERVIEVSKQYFPECTSGLADPRVQIIATDGIKFIEEKKNAFDIIIIDSTDPQDFAEGLFTGPFYQKVNQALRDDGIMMAQTENPFFDEYGVNKIYQNLKNAFPIIQGLSAPMPIYPGSNWTFAFASKKFKATELVEKKISFILKLEKTLKWYNHQWHLGSFCLSNFHKSKMGLE